MKNIEIRKIVLAGAAIVMLVAAGCYSNVDPNYVETEGGVHPFADPAVIGHQEYLADNGYDFNACTDCHGVDLAGEASGPGGSKVRSCYECHSPSEHPGNLTDADNHVTYLRSVDWVSTECLTCHAKATDALFGGSCSSTACHTASAGGSDACNVCHGDFSGDPTESANWAPPEGINGVLSISDPGVGAHQAHMKVDTLQYAQLACSSCHAVPRSVDASYHIDTTTPGVAEVHFSGVASAGGKHPSYDADDATCSATHCHGDAVPVWTVVDGTWSACGTCHGNATTGNPSPHSNENYEITDCATCHGAVINASGTIINASKHVNGVVD
ncbi:MAG: hypothetical protein V2A56_05155 [bacterium]